MTQHSALVAFASLAPFLLPFEVAAFTLGNANAFASQRSMANQNRYVVYETRSTNLAPGQTNSVNRIFRRDNQTGQELHISVPTAGGQPNGDSFSPTISADGNLVAFASVASNLVSGDTNNATDIFVRNISAGTTTRISVTESGGQTNGFSFIPAMSANGQFVVYSSGASNIVAGDTNGVNDIFRVRLSDLNTIRISVSSSHAQADGQSGQPTISSDGNLVAFDSEATNLVASDTNFSTDVFIRNISTGTTTRQSTNSSGAQVGNGGYDPVITPNGDFVVFTSNANNLVTPSTATNRNHIYRKDLGTGITILVSRNEAGTQGNFDSFISSVSGDGNIVGFVSEASNLIGVGNDTNSVRDAFVYNISANTMRRVNVRDDGSQVFDFTSSIGVSDDGLSAAIDTQAALIPARDTNGVWDVYTVSTTTNIRSLPVSVTAWDLE